MGMEQNTRKRGVSRAKESILTRTIVQREINSSSEKLVGSKKIATEIHIKGVGRFCKRQQCGTRIEGKLIRRISPLGKEYVFLRKPLKTQVYCSQHCKNIDNAVSFQKYKKNILHAAFDLRVIDDKTPYRKCTIYVAKSLKKIIKITPKQKEIWIYLESLSRYTKFPAQSIIPLVMKHEN